MEQVNSDKIYIIEVCLFSKLSEVLVENWIKKNGICIYQDNVGKKYISTIQLVYAENMSLIQDLQNDHGDHWRDAFEAHQNVGVMMVTAKAESKKTIRLLSKRNLSQQHYYNLLTRLSKIISER